MMTPPRPRTLLGLAIVLFWLLMIGLLVRRETAAPAPGAAAPAGPASLWLAVRTDGGPRIGTVHLERRAERRGDADGWRLVLDADVALTLLERPTDLAVDGSVWRPTEAASAPVAFDFTVASGGQRFAARGTVAGGLLRATVDAGGEPMPLELPVDQRIAFTGGLGPALVLPPCDAGERFTVEAFDPVTLQAQPATVRCGGRDTLELAGGPAVARRLEIDAGAMTSRAWIDDDGNVLRAATPFGLVLERIPPPPDDAPTSDAAAAATTSGAAADLLARSAVRPTGLTPARGDRALVVRFSGTERPVPAGAHQQRRADGTMRLVASAPPAAGAPGAAACVPAPEHLAADPFVQSAHPRIRARADAIVGDAADTWERARRIHAWVHGHLEKTPVLALPSALEVLADGRGDCNEHTVLFTALARAAGVPTEIAVGLVWSDELGGFYYHAWPEVCAGGRWVRLDPTLGQETADATHVRLLTGSIARWTQLLPYLGRLEIEVLEREGAGDDDAS